MNHPQALPPIGLHGSPTLAELVEAVAEFLADDALIDGERGRYFRRVAANLLGTVTRELEIGPAQERWWREALSNAGFGDVAGLCAAIRRREVTVDDDVVRSLLGPSIAAKLAVSSPAYAATNPDAPA